MSSKFSVGQRVADSIDGHPGTVTDIGDVTAQVRWDAGSPLHRGVTVAFIGDLVAADPAPTFAAGQRVTVRTDYGSAYDDQTGTVVDGDGAAGSGVWVRFVDEQGRTYSVGFTASELIPADPAYPGMSTDAHPLGIADDPMPTVRIVEDGAEISPAEFARRDEIENCEAHIEQLGNDIHDIQWLLDHNSRDIDPDEERAEIMRLQTQQAEYVTELAALRADPAPVVLYDSGDSHGAVPNQDPACDCACCELEREESAAPLLTGEPIPDIMRAATDSLATVTAERDQLRETCRDALAACKEIIEERTAKRDYWRDQYVAARADANGNAELAADLADQLAAMTDHRDYWRNLSGDRLQVIDALAAELVKHVQP